MQKKAQLMSLLAVSFLGVGIQDSVEATTLPPFSETEFIQTSPSQEPAARQRWRSRRSRLPRQVRETLRDPEVQMRLGLSQEQLDQLENGGYEFRQRQIQLRAELQQLRLELRRLLREDPVDRGAVDGAVTRLSETRTQLEKERLNWRLDSREVLTPAQREEIRTILRERRQERRRQKADPPGG